MPAVMSRTIHGITFRLVRYNARSSRPTWSITLEREGEVSLWSPLSIYGCSDIAKDLFLECCRLADSAARLWLSARELGRSTSTLREEEGAWLKELNSTDTNMYRNMAHEMYTAIRARAFPAKPAGCETCRYRLIGHTTERKVCRNLQRTAVSKGATQ